MDSHWLEALVKRFDKENRISSIVSVEIESAVPKGENYGSIVSRASMSVILGSGRKTTKRLIIKETHKVEKIQKLLLEFNVFKSEVLLYQNVLSEMEEIMYEFGDTEDTLWPNMLGYKAYTTIALEDLTLKGFKVRDRSKCLDLEHGFLVVRSLAKYHALSRILLDRGIASKNDLLQFWAASGEEIYVNLLEGSLRQLSDSMKNSWPSKWNPTGLKIEQQISNVVKETKSVFELKEDGFHVLNHGDPWTTNMMFKYSPFKNDPISLKFIDFQMCHYNSYIFDLVHFVYSSIIPDIRRIHLDEILRAYQEALQYYLKSFSYEGKIPDLDHVKAEHQRIQYWSFVCVAVIHPVTTAETTEGLDMDKMVHNDEENNDFINSEVYNSENLINKIGPDLKMYAEKCII